MTREKERMKTWKCGEWAFETEEPGIGGVLSNSEKGIELTLDPIDIFSIHSLFFWQTGSAGVSIPVESPKP